MRRIRVNRDDMLRDAEWSWLRFGDRGYSAGQSWRYLFRWVTGYWDLQ